MDAIKTRRVGSSLGQRLFLHSQGIHAEKGAWKTSNGMLNRKVKLHMGSQVTRGRRTSHAVWRADLLEKMALTRRLLVIVVLCKTKYEENCSKINNWLLSKCFVQAQVTVSQN